MQKFQYSRHNKVPESLIDFLLRRFPYQAKEDWVRNVNSRAVRVNYKRAKPEQILESKDVISYLRPREEEPTVDPNYNIIYEDEYIIAVEKSGNIPISESGKYYQNTLLYILKEQEKYSELYAVHRLDRETSGILVVARHKHIATLLGQQFAESTPKKFYHAILYGETDQNETLVDQPLKKAVGKSKEYDKNFVSIRQVINPEGKQSKTLFKKLKSDDGLTLTEIQTFTGRTHQIRCHAEYINLPILGDKLYGQTDARFLSLMKEKEEPIFEPYGKIDHQLLHASSITIKHPITKEEMTFRSDYQPFFSQYPSIEQFLKK
ncbi:MAG: 23S rRNA pseudouridine955/2504/2580 synthase [bacterium]|jgi:23S rRNA pseudouridine955/2504/2580 synthase